MNTQIVDRQTVNSDLREALTKVDREELFSLLSAHFDGVSFEQFERDLSEKEWVLRLRREDRLVGFSTLRVYRAETVWGPVNVFYSGDTIVAPEAWDSPLLARGWIGLVKRLQRTLDGSPCYWLLLSSGFRTYRFLPVFWRRFWPQVNGLTPAREQALLHGIARRQFGDAYDEQTGVVRFARPQTLKPALSSIPEGREQNPHVRFFRERNPGYLSGDELVCLTELSDENLTRAGVRMVRAAL
jgi:hypothetical protein